MCVHILPFAIHASKQKGLVATIVYYAFVPFYGRFHFSVGHGPREIALHVRLDVGKIQFETIECVAFGFNVMPDQVIKANVLATGLDVTSAFKIQEMFATK